MQIHFFIYLSFFIFVDTVVGELADMTHVAIEVDDANNVCIIHDAHRG